MVTLSINCKTFCLSKISSGLGLLKSILQRSNYLYRDTYGDGAIFHKMHSSDTKDDWLCRQVPITGPGGGLSRNSAPNIINEDRM